METAKPKEEQGAFLSFWMVQSEAYKGESKGFCSSLGSDLEQSTWEVARCGASGWAVQPNVVAVTPPSSDDLSALLKKWVTHEEVTKVHEMLEAFRDMVVEEQAVRKATASMGSGLNSLASGVESARS